VDDVYINGLHFMTVSIYDRAEVFRRTFCKKVLIRVR
jgi:hypothetical protein